MSSQSLVKLMLNFNQSLKKSRVLSSFAICHAVLSVSCASASARLICKMFSGLACSCWLAMWRQQRLAIFAALLLQVQFLHLNYAHSNYNSLIADEHICKVSRT
jgi:hypothetical protein